MNSTTHSSLSHLNVNLLPPIIVSKLAAIDPSSDQRFLPWLKKSFVQKPFDLKPDFTMVINAVLRYMMSLPKRHTIELPSREHLEKWLVQMQWLEQKKYKGVPAVKVMQPKGMNEIPLTLRKSLESQENLSKQLIREMHAGTLYVLTVEPKRWVLVLLNQKQLLNANLECLDPQAFLEQWGKDITERDQDLAEVLYKNLSHFIPKYVHSRYPLVEMEMYYDDFLNGLPLDYLDTDQHVVVHYFQSLQTKEFKQVIHKVA